MTLPHFSGPSPLETLADGTLKQINPFTGTEVWTVPGRGNRPLGVKKQDPQPLKPEDFTNSSAFGSDNYLKTPPEKARMVRRGNEWFTLQGLLPEQLFDEVAEFRRVPNLFEIVGYDYWHKNFDYQPDAETADRMAKYLADPAGREHVLNIVRTRLKAAGLAEAAIAELSEEELLAKGVGYFAGGHDVIVARRHFTDGATHDDQLAGSGTMSVDEHRHYIEFTVDALADLYRRNRYVRYVAVFQNWLKPAGASFDHLHKQLVAIDTHGVQAALEIARVRANPNAYNEWAVDYAARHNLTIAENDHAVAFAGFGHRYPTIEVYSKSAVCEPWLMSAAERDGMADIIHACHAAAGADVPCNEEWHHRAPDLDLQVPWHVAIKWRVSNLAGFEGGTKIYLNTISPANIRARVLPELERLRASGEIAADIRIGAECSNSPNSLKYNPLLQ